MIERRQQSSLAIFCTAESISNLVLMGLLKGPAVHDVIATVESRLETAIPNAPSFGTSTLC